MLEGALYKRLESHSTRQSESSLPFFERPELRRDKKLRRGGGKRIENGYRWYTYVVGKNEKKKRGKKEGGGGSPCRGGKKFQVCAVHSRFGQFLAIFRKSVSGAS